MKPPHRKNRAPGRKSTRSTTATKRFIAEGDPPTKTTKKKARRAAAKSPPAAKSTSTKKSPPTPEAPPAEAAAPPASKGSKEAVAPDAPAHTPVNRKRMNAETKKARRQGKTRRLLDSTARAQQEKNSADKKKMSAEEKKRAYSEKKKSDAAKKKAAAEKKAAMKALISTAPKTTSTSRPRACDQKMDASPSPLKGGSSPKSKGDNAQKGDRRKTNYDPVYPLQNYPPIPKFFFPQDDDPEPVTCLYNFLFDTGMSDDDSDTDKKRPCARVYSRMMDQKHYPSKRWEVLGVEWRLKGECALFLYRIRFWRRTTHLCLMCFCLGCVFVWIMILQPTKHLCMRHFCTERDIDIRVTYCKRHDFV